MKTILTAFAMLLSMAVSAQKFEAGIAGGLSTTTKPHRALYKGDDNIWNYTAGVNFHYSFTERWNAGLSIGMTRWERKSEWPLYSTDNDSLGPQPVNYLFAKRAVSFAFEFNHVLPFYVQYEDLVRSQLYIGVAAGAVVTGNDGKIVYDKVNPHTPAEYTYTSEFHYQSGYGFLLGAQIGYTYFLGEHLGINLEFAPKITWVKTVDPRYSNVNDSYNLIYFPTTIGIRYRWGYDTGGSF